MPFSKKNLDDRSFKDLFDDLKRRIPLYLPDWTDHNESDPGIAMAQLFAWLTETMIVRLNQVPDQRMYVAFLDLLDQAPRPAQPAQAPIRFDLTPGSGGRTYPGFELRLSGSGPDGEVPFEAAEDVPLVGATLARLLVDDGLSGQPRDVTKENEKRTTGFGPFGTSRVRDRALYFGLNTRLTATGLEPLVPVGPPIPMRFYARIEEAGRPLEPGTTSIPPAVTSLDSDLIWEGRTATGWIALQTADETRGLTKDGFVRLMLPQTLASARLDPSDPDELFWIRVRATSEAPERRRLLWISPNVAIVWQWRTHAQEQLLPGSNGEANQRRAVRYPPILDDPRAPVKVEVREPVDSGGTAWVVWKESDELPDPGFQPDSEAEVPRTFRVDDRREIVFGDGRYSRIPPRGPNNLRVTYRSGGGARGNLGLNALSLVQPPPGVEAAEQLEAPSGGEDEEDLQTALERAADETKAQHRAVTERDFETLAVKVGAARANALNRYHPRYPAVPVTGAITLVVVPPADPEERAPRPDQSFLDEIARKMEQFRVLTTELFVVAPDYHRVKITADLQIDDETRASTIRDQAVAALHALFHPITGGAEGKGWPLGGEIPYGLLVSTAGDLPGVAFVRSLIIELDGRRQPPCQDVPLPSRLALVESEQHVINIRARTGR